MTYLYYTTRKYIDVYGRAVLIIRWHCTSHIFLYVTLFHFSQRKCIKTTKMTRTILRYTFKIFTNTQLVMNYKVSVFHLSHFG